MCSPSLHDHPWLSGAAAAARKLSRPVAQTETWCMEVPCGKRHRVRPGAVGAGSGQVHRTLRYRGFEAEATREGLGWSYLAGS